MKISTTALLKAIRKQCLECMGGSSHEVDLCTDNLADTHNKRQCPLYDLREVAKNPYSVKQ